jgi:outer membrane protein OmpA-like peptidoglycan-associated protein
MRLRMLGQAVCALVLAAIATADAADAPSPRIPFVVGLTTVRATSEPRGDYENLRVIDSITPAGYRITISGEVPADDGSGLLEINIARRVRAEDQRGARTLRAYFHTGDAEQFSNTVPGLSAAIVNDLRKTGRAQLTWLDVGVLFGMTVVRGELSGTIARVDGGETTLPMLVNGHRVQLPVIHAKGRLSDGAEAEDFEFHALDDPDNPILLRTRGPGFSSAVIKIDYPQAKQEHASSSIESELAARRPAEVYGIYFSFARADIRPQSERTLKEIASVLNAHPDWKLRIDGHTDNIGGDVENLSLSKHRAAAVKTALVSRFHIEATRLSTGGYGEASPREKNDTPEGRALNRRVELTRL